MKMIWIIQEKRNNDFSNVFQVFIVSDNLQPERVKNRHKKNVIEKSGSWANKKVSIFFFLRGFPLLS